MNHAKKIEKKYSVDVQQGADNKLIQIEEVVGDLIVSYREYKQALSRKDIIKSILRNQYK